MRTALLLQVFVFYSAFCLAQNTVGLISYNANKAYDGYNLLYPHDQANVYLLNNCGEIVHIWEDEEHFRPGNSAYLMPNGNLVKTKRNRVIEGPITVSGRAETVEVRDWDNNLIASFFANDSLQRLHHDIALTDNGTVLMVSWDLKTKLECHEAGRDTSLMQDEVVLSEKIMEWDPETDSIIWEWFVWDHLIQDFDSTKLNYGVLEENFNKIHVNRYTNNGDEDWLHINSIDYDSDRQLILLSVPYFHEAWVIDHSTTTEEARGSVGGRANRGGDLVYRWGNPFSYEMGTLDDKQLFFPHDVNWVDDFIDDSNIHYKKISAYNNRVGADFSSAVIWDPGYDFSIWNGLSFEENEGLYSPQVFDRVIHHPDTTKMYSATISSAQVLPNENVLICVGRRGYSFEITPDNEVVWEYITPLRNGFLVTQGDIVDEFRNSTFQFKRYPVDFPGFEGRDLSSKGTLELEPNTSFCEEITSTEGIEKLKLQIFPNPADQLIRVDLKGDQMEQADIYSFLGELQFTKSNISSNRLSIDVSSFPTGLYIIRINNSFSSFFVVER